MNEIGLLECSHGSLHILADKLVAKTQELLKIAKTEEDLKIGFEKLLEPIKTQLKLKFRNVKYEKSVYQGRVDALHGQLVIEYEAPRSLGNTTKFAHALEQLKNYLTDPDHSQAAGVGFDGQQIFFVRKKTTKASDSSEFSVEGPYDFTPESAKTLLIYLRALSRLPLTAENLAQKFGPQGTIAANMISALVNALHYWGEPDRIRTFFNEWQRLFGIVYGEQFVSSNQEDVTKTLAYPYKIQASTNFPELLFCIHTYFALLMKLITVEILTLRDTAFGSSFASELANAHKEELKRQLEDMENGGIYSRKGITNFLEGDFFRWYLDAFESPELKDAIREIARALSEFEPATSTLDPASTRDLLKKLYQYLVPQAVRHRLGEYYTPDWLAEFLLEEVGYFGHTSHRFLDPACGSGTFLVLAINRAIQYGKTTEQLSNYEIANRIVANIWGFDLNPLAVIAARTNYLFALGDLVNDLLNQGQTIEIPIYLCDSVLTPTRTTGDLFGKFLEVATSVGKFQVPVEWVKDGGFSLARAAPLIEEMVKNRYSVEEAMSRLQTEGLAFTFNEQIVKNFYSQILELEKQNKNGIWARFLKNVFAPKMAGQFDFVVGNPPWIRWRFLSKEYREATTPLWKNYKLFSLKGYAQMLGGAEPDFSMLFVYASSDYYLKDGAKLGFLITQEVFKSKGAGEGFRRFQLGDKKYLKVLKAHDLASVQPFEGATNKTAAIILKKGEKTEYPVPYIAWTKKKGVGKIATDKLLDEVLPLLQKKKYVAKPIGSNVGSWQTQSIELEKLSKIEGKNYYLARKGVSPEPYGVFWLEIKQVLSNGDLIICNLSKKGKFSIQPIEERIEQDLVYPAIRGRDITRWGFRVEIYFILVNDPDNPMSGYLEETMKKKWPRTYSYLLNFKNILLQRAAYKKFHKNAGHPFYSQYNFGKYTLSLYKVVWGYMSNDISASVVSSIKTPIGFKNIIPFNTITFFTTDNESEAHYLCAIINSTPVRDFIKSFSSAGRGFGTPSVMEHVGIPKFDPNNEIHQKLAEVSKQCHWLKTEGKESEIAQLEQENDNLVRQLFGIS